MSVKLRSLDEVPVPEFPAENLRTVVGSERVALLRERLSAASRLLGNGVIWHVNATAAGGGVAEMLHVLLGYARAEGIDARWLALRGDAEFFAVTKRLHNALLGSGGDGGPLGAAEREHYEGTLEGSARELESLVCSGDLVVLHDPQTAGLIPATRAAGAKVVWRCHPGNAEPNEFTRRFWGFVRGYLEQADAYVFSNAAYVPEWMDTSKVHIITPSLDPLSAKNQDLDAGTARAILARAGIIDGDSPTEPLFTRRDGTTGKVSCEADIIGCGPAPNEDVPLVVQVSRWDRLKDMAGAMEGFARLVPHDSRAHLVLAGPEVRGVSDDPEAAQTLDECYARWRDLPSDKRSRIRLVCLPMDDLEENAAVVNALQRHTKIVVHKSRAEGFGLTLTEGMWKGKPAIANNLHASRTQVSHGRQGLLLDDPDDEESFADALRQLLSNPVRAEKLGRAAHEKVKKCFLSDSHLMRYADLVEDLYTR
jgi:trehalose synthase